MNRRFFTFFVLALLLCGCMSQQQKMDLVTVDQTGVSPATYETMTNFGRLTLGEIKDLSAHHVGDDIIIRYLRSTRAVYYLSLKIVGNLKKAGVSDAVVDYLLSTPQLYPEMTYRDRRGFWPEDPYGLSGPWDPEYYQPVIIYRNGSYHH